MAPEGDLKLLAWEQVLEDEALATAEDTAEGGQEELEDFDHRGRIAQSMHPRRYGAQTFALLHACSGYPGDHPIDLWWTFRGALSCRLEGQMSRRL